MFKLKTCTRNNDNTLSCKKVLMTEIAQCFILNIRFLVFRPVQNVLDQAFFIVTEKDDILGQITLPVTTLTGMKDRERIIDLQPHKKCPKPQGKLVFECFVSEYHTAGEHTPVIMGGCTLPDEVRPKSAFQRLRKRMASPVTQRRNKKEDSREQKSGLSTFNKKFSRSIQDLFSFSKYNASEIDIGDNESTTSSIKSSNKTKKNRRISIGFLSIGNDLDKLGRSDAKIISCVPNSGPVDHPTRLAIEGRDLAIGKSEIKALIVAGCDCTDTVEFDSPNRIYCSTHYFKACTGDIELETYSGGKCFLKNGFTFHEELNANENTCTSLNPFDDSVDGSIQDDSSEKIDFNIGGHEIRVSKNDV